MKKTLVYAVLLIIPLLLNGFTFSDFFGKKNQKQINAENTIAIGKFQLSGNASKSQYAELLEGFRTYMNDAFAKHGNYKVINKQRVDEVIETNEVYESIKIKKRGDKVSGKAVNKYEEANAEYVLLGEIKNFSVDKLRGSKLNNGTVATISKKNMVVDSYLSVSLIHVKTQEIIANENLKIRKLLEDTGNSDTLISDALETLSNEVVSKLLLSLTGEIKVLSIQDNQVVLNKGSSNGLQKAMSFDIYTPTEISGHKSQKKVATVTIERTDKEISFATLSNIIALPKGGDIAKIVESKKAEFVKEKIRVAIGDVIISESNIRRNNQLASYMSNDLEYAFSQNSAFVVTNDDIEQTNALLAQQVLDELNKGREAGLPLGSLRGVDYLVFSTMDYLNFNSKKTTVEYIKALDIKTSKTKDAVIKMNGYVYLIDVNTANKIASVPVMAQYTCSKDISGGEILKNLSQTFTKATAKAIFPILSPTRILKVVDTHRVVLNAGKDIGLQMDDLLDVYGKEEMITDEYTGVTKAISGLKIAQIKIIDFLASGEAVAQVMQGYGLQAGFKTKLIQSETPKQPVVAATIQQQIAMTDNGKRYLAIKDLKISDNISSSKRRLLKSESLNATMRSIINKSKKFRVLSRDKDMIRQIMEEKQIAQSSLADAHNEEAMLLSITDYMFLPKVTNFILYRKTEKLPDIEVYEHKDYVELEMGVALLNTKGEVLFETTASDKYFKAWTSEKSLKNTIPARRHIENLAKKILKKVTQELIEEQS